jgi:hypothetical protein
MLDSCLAYIAILKMDAICFLKMSADFHRITWRYIPEERALQMSQFHAPFLTIDFNIILPRRPRNLFASDYVIQSNCLLLPPF